MKLFATLRSFAASFIHRDQVNREMDEELRSHILHRADDLERSGLHRAEAERRARIEFGGYQRFREESHEELSGSFVETLIQDVRFGLRILGRSPSFTVIAVLTLAFAIGSNAVVFSVLNGLVLRPLNVPGTQSLYMIEQGTSDDSTLQSYPDYRDLRDRNRTFEDIAVYNMSEAGIGTGGDPSHTWLYEASGNYFDVLGIQPYLGRFFHSSDEHGPNSAPYIVLSYPYWQNHFAGDREVVGRIVQVNRHPYTILGVAPPGFIGTEVFWTPDFWAPIVDEEQIEGASDLDVRANHGSWIVGRLKPGVTPAQATADLNSVGAYLSKTYPKDDDHISFTLSRPGLIGNMLGRPVRAFSAGLMLLAGLILVAACANLGSLFAARAADRSKEIAMRLALGSSRRRILRQLLTEAILVSLMGGVVGLAGGVTLLRWLSVWQPLASYPIHLPVNPDLNVYGIALLLALVSGLLFGLVPVRQVLRANPYQIVKSGPSGVPGRGLTMRDILLSVQITLCAVLVTSSLVAVRGLARSMHINFGFIPQNAMLVNTDLDMAGYSGNQIPQMQRHIVEAVAAMPGVTSVGLADRLPLAMDWNIASVFRDNASDFRYSSAAAQSMLYSITPGYLNAAGTVLLSGRLITWQDDQNAPKVAIVNRELAREVFGSEASVVGRYFKKGDGTRIQVIGLVENGKHRTLTEDAQPAMFLPILQSPSSSTWLVVRSARDPRELSENIRLTLHNLDPALPLVIKTWNKQLDGALFPSRVATIALGILGVLGAMLAATGIFGMAAYSVSRRLREFGIRIALGAQHREVLGAALGRAFRLLAFGSVAGLLLGLAATKVLSFIVYQATPRDPLVLAGTVCTMLLLGLVATWLPAMRALKADPMILLRDE